MPRRQAGSLYRKKGSTRYYGAFTLPNGKRVVRALLHDKQSSQAMLAELILQSEREYAGLAAPGDRANSELATDATERYLKSCARIESKRHVACKRLHIHRLLDASTWRSLDELEARTAELVLAALLDEGKSPRTANTHRASWIAWGRWLVEQSLISSNPFAKLKRFDEAKDTRRRRRALTQREIERLLLAAELRPLAEYGRRTNPGRPQGSRKGWSKEQLEYSLLQDVCVRAEQALSESPAFIRKLRERGRLRRACYLCMLLTGMRRGEVVALRWCDIDEAEQVVRLSAAITKAGRDEEIPLHPQALQTLRAIRPPNARPGDRIFPVVPGIRQFDLDLQAAGIEKRDARDLVVDIHALRTTTGTMLARAGVPPAVTQRILRHADMATTLKHYTALNRRDQVEALARLEIPDPPSPPAA